MLNPYKQAFERLKSNQFIVANTTYKERISKLEKLHKAIATTYKSDIRDAMIKDFGKPVLETDLTEIYPVVDEIKKVKIYLRHWMKPKRVATPLVLIGSQSCVQYEPKGVCLIISPWNYPFTLTFGPLVSAIASGNSVIIKPSEISQHSSRVMQKIVGELFSEDEIVLVQGDAKVSQQLLELPFNHIFFTGSSRVGKIVMKAASENLGSVTLELGGKSPVFIDGTTNFKDTAEKIALGKFLNTGQTCIAPDYILIEKSKAQDFIETLQNITVRFYGESPKNSNSYGRLISKEHFNRIKEMVDDAKDKGAEIVQFSQAEESIKFFPPTIILNPTDDMKVMREEIFGPILPVKTYNTIDEAIEYVNSKDRPLALYIFSKNKKYIKSILANVRAGGTSINHNLLHFLNSNLPFGGINNSGIGKSHGFYGFKAFSNEKAVLKQFSFSSVSLIYPPFNNFKQKIIDLLIKYF